MISLLDAELDDAGAGGPRAPSAVEAAGSRLIEALARLLESTREPACVAWLGPIVPGATMAGGARVPGTSYDLDPAQAAFNIALLMSWPGGAADAPRAACESQPLEAALLAVGDYLARRTVALGGSPFTVGQLIQQLARALDPADEARYATGSIQELQARCAGLTARLLGGAPDAGNAAQHGTSLPHAGPVEPWQTAEAVAQGVRIGLLSLRWPADRSHALGGGAEPHRPDVATPAVFPALLAPVALRRFESAVLAHYPAAQAARIRDTVSDPARFRALGVHELLALLARN